MGEKHRANPHFSLSLPVNGEQELGSTLTFAAQVTSSLEFQGSVHYSEPPALLHRVALSALPFCPKAFAQANPAIGQFPPKEPPGLAPSTPLRTSFDDSEMGPDTCHR